jgi:LPXTG-motif cell wall-anchored protein
MGTMKKYTSKLIIFAVFVFVFMVIGQSAYAMGFRYTGGSSGNGSSNTRSVPDPVTTLSFLGAGVAGVGAYLLIRKKKDK